MSVNVPIPSEGKGAVATIAATTALCCGVGATIGSMVPVIGTATGAVVGAGIGSITSGILVIVNHFKKK